MKLMIVDDSNVMRRKITRAVSKMNIQDIVTASNGVEALEVFQAQKPSLVTMDITMPEMDGVACVKELIKQDPNILILVVSAVTEKATTMEALSSGAKGFVQKPFDDDQLNLALRQIMSDAVA